MFHVFETKVVKDPVHTSIKLPSDFFKLIDDPLFQRLRYIKQTGLSHLVYPGLRHSRFEHSLGVAYLMLTALDAIHRNTVQVYGPTSSIARITGRLVEDPSLWCAAGIAALLHDIGHLAWSHVFESALVDYYTISSSRREPPDVVSLESHEQLTLKLAVRLLTKHDDVCGIDGRELTEMVEKVLSYAYTTGLWSSRERGDVDPLLIPARLLSGTVDVDRGDYLIRDSRSAGVSYGLYDVDRLISVLVAVEEPRVSDKTGLPLDVGVVDKGISVVETMLLGRMYMYSEVYLHDVVLAYEASAARLLSLLMYAARLLAEEGYPGVTGFERRMFECMTSLLSGNLEEEDGTKLEECARLLTDPAVETLAELLAYKSSSLYDALKSIEQGSWLCPALSIYSKALTTRKHPMGAYLSGRRANILVRRISVKRKLHRPQDLIRVLPSYVKALQETPLITFSYTSYPIYSTDDPVLVLNRRTKQVYALHELSISPTAELLSRVDTWSKIVITAPLSTSPSHYTNLKIREGKIDEEEVIDAYTSCGYSIDDAHAELKGLKNLLDEILAELERLIGPLH